MKRFGLLLILASLFILTSCGGDETSGPKNRVVVDGESLEITAAFVGEQSFEEDEDRYYVILTDGEFGEGWPINYDFMFSLDLRSRDLSSLELGSYNLIEFGSEVPANDSYGYCTFERGEDGWNLKGSVEISGTYPDDVTFTFNVISYGSEEVVTITGKYRGAIEIKVLT